MFFSVAGNTQPSNIKRFFIIIMMCIKIIANFPTLGTFARGLDATSLKCRRHYFMRRYFFGILAFPLHYMHGISSVAIAPIFCIPSGIIFSFFYGATSITGFFLWTTLLFLVDFGSAFSAFVLFHDSASLTVGIIYIMRCRASSIIFKYFNIF